MSPRLPRVTSSELLRALQRAGRQRKRQTGSHVHLVHADRRGVVTMAVHAGAVVKPKTLQAILEQAGLTADDLRDLL